MFARVTAMRLWSVPFLLITVIATWLLAGTVFGPRRELQLAAAAVPALFPMIAFISSSISPDGVTFALWSVAFLLGARVLLRRGGVADLIGLLAVLGLAVATKAVSAWRSPPPCCWCSACRCGGIATGAGLCRRCAYRASCYSWRRSAPGS